MSHPQRDRADCSAAVPIQIFRLPKGGGSARVCMLGVDYGGLFTHQVKGRGEYCKGDECRGDWHKEKRFWKGYTPGLVYSDATGLWNPYCIEITQNAEQDLRGRYQRGQVWRFVKGIKDGQKVMSVTAELVEVRSPDEVMASFDIRPCLLSVYNVELLNLSQKNPLPGRVLVEPVSMAPPRGVSPPETASLEAIKASGREELERLKAAGQWLGRGQR